jgi:hypothetical protein
MWNCTVKRPFPTFLTGIYIFLWKSYHNSGEILKFVITSEDFLFGFRKYGINEATDKMKYIWNEQQLTWKFINEGKRWGIISRIAHRILNSS